MFTKIIHNYSYGLQIGLVTNVGKRHAAKSCSSAKRRGGGLGPAPAKCPNSTGIGEVLFMPPENPKAIEVQLTFMYPRLAALIKLVLKALAFFFVTSNLRPFFLPLMK